MVEIVEVGPRDGFQIEAKPIPTADKIRFIDRLAACGFKAMEIAAFVSPKAVPQMSDAADVLAGIDRARGVKMRALVPNARGAERAAAAHVDEMVAIVSASESHNRANLNRAIDESLGNITQLAGIAAAAGIPVHGGISTAFGCPFEGDVPVEQVIRIANSLAGIGVRSLTLGDTTGMATPSLVKQLCAALAEGAPAVKITLHFHNTRGLGLVNVMAGLEAGVTSFESTIAGIGGCPFAPGATGNVVTEDVIHMMDTLGIKTGLNLKSLIGVARELESFLGRPLPGQVMKAGPRLTLHPLDSVTAARA